MFNKILYNRNAYDRSVSDELFSCIILGTGNMVPRINIKTQLYFPELHGVGVLNSELILHAIINPSFSSETVVKCTVVLKLSLAIDLSGTSLFNPGMSSKVPFTVNFSGQGSMFSTNDFVYQIVTSNLSGNGFLNNELIAAQFIDISFSGNSTVNGLLLLLLELMINKIGAGELILKRLGNFNENVFELDGINATENDTILIDTDELTVFINSINDVSSVTTDSIFFELSPGENEIKFENDGDSPMNITIIWQNRWL